MDCTRELYSGFRSALAERNTSGEIRVHLEAHSGTDAFARATEVFGLLHMNNTKQSNGVLIYIAVKDKALVILGDSGINRAVPPDFWEGTKNLIVAAFKSGTIKQGLVNGILQAGQQLKEHFPHRAGDVNELPDGISVG
ncbi:MAG: TPM domain-containing protein [Marinirhabdus sp.]